MMSKEYPFVSIIIPTKNSAKHIGECLRSIRNLDYPSDRFETIVIDGNSIDSTKHIAEEHGATVFAGSAESPETARMEGLQYAHGTIIAFTDADVVVHADWLQKAVEILATESRVTVVGGPVLHPAQGIFATATQVLFDLLAAMGISNSDATLSKRKTVEKIGCVNFVCRAETLRALLPWKWNGYGGDLVLCDQIRMMNEAVLVRDPTVIVEHYKRSDPLNLFIEMVKWGSGRGRMEIVFHDRRFIRACAGYSLPVSIATAITLSFAYGVSWLPWTTPIVCIPLIAEAVWATKEKRSIAVGLLSPIAAIVMVCGWSTGFTLGRISRFYVRGFSRLRITRSGIHT